MPLWNVDSCLVVTRICFASLDPVWAKPAFNADETCQLKQCRPFGQLGPFLHLSICCKFRIFQIFARSSAFKCRTPYRASLTWTVHQNFKSATKEQDSTQYKNMQEWSINWIKMTLKRLGFSFPANVVSVASSLVRSRNRQLHLQVLCSTDLRQEDLNCSQSTQYAMGKLTQSRN